MRVHAHTFFSDFREFAMKGNVADLAIGVVIGTAFGKIVSSLVGDIITPLMGLFLGGVDFKHLSVTLWGIKGSANEVVLTYGLFLQNVFDFVIIALVLFLFIRLMSRVKRQFEKAQKIGEIAKHERTILLEEIRDLLRGKSN